MPKAKVVYKQREHDCSPAKVANYLGAYRPTCNDGFGCSACWRRYHELNPGVSWLPTGLFQENALKKLGRVLSKTGWRNDHTPMKLSVRNQQSDGALILVFEAKIRPTNKGRKSK